MLRSVLAVMVGYLVTGIAVLLATIAAARLILGGSMLDPSVQPTTPYLMVNVVYSLAFAALGGYVAATIARRQPLLHGAALGGLMLVLGLLSAKSSTNRQGGQPSWYPLLMTVGGASLAAVGGYLRGLRARPQAKDVAVV